MPQILEAPGVWKHLLMAVGCSLFDSESMFWLAVLLGFLDKNGSEPKTTAPRQDMGSRREGNNTPFIG